jgi:antitoxin MazE
MIRTLVPEHRGNNNPISAYLKKHGFNTLRIMVMAYILSRKKPGNDKIKKIVVGEEGRLRKPLRQLDRSALAADLRRLQATMPLTLWVIQDCRAGERW